MAHSLEQTVALLARTPDAGAGTSSTTLSVSISTRISSASTASPGFFFHCSSVASLIDSDSCGTFTSINDMSFAWLFSESARHFVKTKPFSLANA